MITHERLLEVLFYNPDSDNFYWRYIKGRSQTLWPAGTRLNAGYISIGIEGELYLAHRLAWFYITGTWPDDQIDHKDRNRSNNRWSNLREASNEENSLNKSFYKNNKTGYRGVVWNKNKRLYQASISIKGKTKYLGRYKTAEEASEASEAYELVRESLYETS